MMRKKMRVSLLVSVCMALLLCGCSKEESYAPLTKSDMKVDVVLTPRGFENQIYTSYLYQIPFITQYHGVDIRELFTKDLFRLSLVSERRGVAIELKMHETELNEEITERYVLPGEGDTLWMQPHMVWKYDALRKFDKTRNMAFRWTVLSDGEEVCTIERTFSCRSVSQCVNAVMVTPSERIEGLMLNEDGAVEIPEMFAGYVEEENAAIDAILDHALKDCYLPGGFDGYLSGDEDYLLQQMCAIWYVLQQSKIRYSNATDVPGSATSVRVQNVRFFDQVLAASQANCVEGTCLLASIYQRFNLYPYLILRPGHMFLGIGNAQGNLAYLLETTMIGSVDLDTCSTDEEKWEASKANFKAALEAGLEEFEEVKIHLDAGDPYYSVINLRAVRAVIPSINYGSVRVDSKGQIEWTE